MPECHNCGHQLAAGAQVCERCQAPVAAATSAYAAGPPPPPAYGGYGSAPPPLPPPPATPWGGQQATYLPPSGYPQGEPGYGYGQGGYGGPGGYPPPPNRTNGLAIASLVTSLVGLVTCGLGSIAGVVLGHMAMGQIKRSQGREEGRGLAIGGLAVGYAVIALVVGYFVVVGILVAADSS